MSFSGRFWKEEKKGQTSEKVQEGEKEKKQEGEIGKERQPLGFFYGANLGRLY